MGNARFDLRGSKESKQCDPSGEHAEDLGPDVYRPSHDMGGMCNNKEPPPAIAIVGSGACVGLVALCGYTCFS